MRVAFIGNFYKTAVYEAIAKRLSAYYGIEVYWIMPKLSQYLSFVEKYGEKHILLIDKSLINEDARVCGDFKINEIVYGDRVWKYDFNTGIKYLSSIQGPIKDFLVRNGIETVFGENTTCEELLICRMCNYSKDINCDYFSLMTTRIPNGRFFFFMDEKQCEVWKGHISAEEVNVELELVKPKYLALNDGILKKKMSLKGMLKRLGYFITDEHIEKSDPNVITKKGTRLAVMGTEVLNQQLYRFVETDSIDKLKDKKYVFYGFHKQPEASIDVCGRYNENQNYVIENIWRQLPSDWYLVIKEHTNAIGNRSPREYRKIRKYPRTILINESIDSKLIIQHAEAVITNTGTMALEAVLMNVPAITLSRVVFNCINYCKYMTWHDFEKYNSLETVINEIRSQVVDVEPYRELVAKYSFEGTMGDTFGTPTILENDDNLEKLTNAFATVALREENGFA